MITVLGGTGTTGRRVTARLLARGADVRVGSRRGTPPLDWHDRATWGPVLAGTRSAYLAFHPDLALPGVPQLLGAFAAAARAEGVEHLVLLSGRGEEGAAATEDAVRASGPELTVLRCNWFAQDFSEHFLLPAVRSGTLALPAGDAVEPFVDADDVADVAVEVLLGGRHRGAVLELSGPRPLSFADVAAELTRASGHEVRYVPSTRDACAAELVAQGLPAELADLFALVLDGRNATPTGDVERVLGRPPRDFTDYATATADTGVWSPAAVAR
ncbi:Rossmann-fold NAD(P)-binding domain-containing protein [Kineococcus sp. SYSU DK004]|uniref:NmrA family transcriptional regulator n=1 Tax=Kineococcus sp. SYSU DK004 TaxID=3383125 RepID=UPI003D7DBBCF